MVPVLSIVGKSGSGKTTLLEKLIPELERREYKVGTIKHDAHDFEIDHPGKDTYRHFHAGAHQVLIASAHKIALVKRTSRRPSLDDLITTYFSDMDIVLTEGYKSGKKPKIEVFRSEMHKVPLCSTGDNLVAFVSDSLPTEDVPRFLPGQIEELAGFIERFFLGKV